MSAPPPAERPPAEPSGAPASPERPAARHRIPTPLALAGQLVAAEPRRVLIPVVLFLATIASTLHVGRLFVESYELEAGVQLAGSGTLLDGWPYALPLLAILFFHEMGHYVAARIHRVPVTLPYFIPIPFFFGTFGAVIRTRGAIRSRNALLDVGAAGPLAGLVVAIPCMIGGLFLSPVQPLPDGPYQQEGLSLLYLLLKYLVVGPIPEGYDVFLHPVAWAAWIGFLVTMINLIPVGQLDGGHITYALSAEVYRTVSRLARRSLIGLGLLVGGWFGTQALLAGRPAGEVAAEFAAGLNWLVWAGFLWILGRAAGGRHPPVDNEPLSPVRRALGITCLVAFLLLFMAVPLRAVSP